MSDFEKRTIEELAKENEELRKQLGMKKKAKDVKPGVPRFVLCDVGETQCYVFDRKTKKAFESIGEKKQLAGFDKFLNENISWDDKFDPTMPKSMRYVQHLLNKKCEEVVLNFLLSEDSPQRIFERAIGGRYEPY